jgi:hypothetical protein
MFWETQPIYTLFTLLFEEELIDLEDSSEGFILFLTTTQNMKVLPPEHQNMTCSHQHCILVCVYIA